MARRIRRHLPELRVSLQLQNKSPHTQPLICEGLCFPKGAPLFVRFVLQAAGLSHSPPPTLSPLVSQSSLKGSTFPELFDWSLENTGLRGRRDEWAESHSPSQSGLQSKHCLLTLTRSENGEKEKKREKQMHCWHGFQLIVCHESKSQLPC